MNTPAAADDAPRNESVSSTRTSQRQVVDPPNLDGDWIHFHLLTILYILQGFPSALSECLPIFLQDTVTLTYTDQALLSLAMWPTCTKPLWAPLVDSFYVHRIGRRKCWVLPIVLLMGFMFLLFSYYFDEWIPKNGEPNLKMIIAMIFGLNMLSTIEDIVVDAWSLTIFKRKNRIYAPICNVLGLQIGMCLCYISINGIDGEIISIKNSFVCYFITALVITILIGTYQKENDCRLESGYVKISVFQNYKLEWDIIKSPRIRILAVILLTSTIGFSAVDNIFFLKLIDDGLSSHTIFPIILVITVMKAILPVFVKTYVMSPEPMTYYLKTTPVRLIWSILYTWLIFFTPRFTHKNGHFRLPIHFYFTILIICIIYELITSFMLLMMYAFFCRLSDPRFGGTYMTLFNTFYHLGETIWSTVILKLTAILTFYICSKDNQNDCSTPALHKQCESIGGHCHVRLDGYYVTSFVCMVIGFIWYGGFKNIIKEFESLNPASDWTVGSFHAENAN